MWTSLITLAGLALAEEPAPPAEAEAPQPVSPESAPGALEALQAELADARAQTTDVAALERLVGDASALLDPRTSPDAQVAAAQALGEAADPRAWPFLASVVGFAAPEVRAAALTALAGLPSEETVTLAVAVMQDRAQVESVRLAAIELLGALQLPAAADALYAFAGGDERSGVLRGAATEALRAHYPALLAERGEPVLTLERSGWDAAIGVGANGVAVGVLLSSVGAVGQSDLGVGVGAVGGGLIGVGTGVSYAVTHPVSLANNLQYATGVGWGLDLAVHATGALFSNSERLTRERGGAALRAAGVGLGAGLSFSQFDNGRSPADVFEVNASMLLGQQLAAGTAYYLNLRNPDEALSDQRRPHVVGAANVGGALAGAGAGLLLRDRWELGPEDALFGSVGYGVGAWAAFWGAVHLDVPDLGPPRIGGAALSAGALTLSELRPASLQSSLCTSLGFVSGNFVGWGIAESVDDSKSPLALALGGLAGSAAGYALGEWVEPSRGDLTLLGVGSSLLIAESFALGFSLQDKFPGQIHDVNGSFLATGLIPLTLLGAGHFIEPSRGQVVLVGTAGIWGGWFAFFTPLALGVQGDLSDGLLAASGMADVFMVGAGLTQLPAIGLDPRRTLIPQLGAVSGATVGALGAALSSADPKTIAGGAVIGSFAGMVGGTVVELRRGNRPRATLPTPHLSLNPPGTWQVSAVPTDIEGEPGLQVGLNVSGW